MNCFWLITFPIILLIGEVLFCLFCKREHIKACFCEHIKRTNREHIKGQKREHIKE